MIENNIIDLTLYHCVYKTSHPLGFFYIGKGLTKRVMNGTYKGSGYKLKCAMAYKYPYEEWTSEILATFREQKEAYDYERSLVTFEVIADPYCMNLVIGGKGGHKWTSGLSRGLAISKSLAGKPRGPQKKSTVEKRTKKLNTEEVREKTRKTKEQNGTLNFGYVWTEEQRNAQSLQAKNNPNYKHTEEQKQAAREIMLNKSDEEKDIISKKISNAVKASITPEVIEKIANTKRGRKWYHHPETKHQIFVHPCDEPNDYILGRCDGVGWNTSINDKPRTQQTIDKMVVALKNKPEDEKKRLIECRMKQVRGKRWVINPLTNHKMFIFPENIPDGYIFGRGKIKR